MPKASVKRLIECKKEDLIKLVLDIEKYPEFVPFCFDAKVYENKNEGDLTKIMHEKYSGKLNNILGLSEETTTGVQRLYDMQEKDILEFETIKYKNINLGDKVKINLNQSNGILGFGWSHPSYGSKINNSGAWTEGNFSNLMGSGLLVLY